MSIQVRCSVKALGPCPYAHGLSWSRIPGTYLGIDVAIKNEYDVSKYFEREWRLMKSVLLSSHRLTGQPDRWTPGRPATQMSFFASVFHEHRLQITEFLLFQSLLRMVSIVHLLLNSRS